MTVTPDSDAAPWDGAPREPYESLPPEFAPQPVPPSRRGFRRVAAAGGGLVLLLAAAVLFVLANPPSPAASTSRLASYVPADAVVYIEVRLDLPGDQRANLTGLLSAFPGLDEAGLEQKLNALLAELGEQGIDWTTDVEPWFDGQTVISIDEIPLSSSGDRPKPSFTAVMALRDRSAFLSFLERQPSFEELRPADAYRGASVWTGELSGDDVALALTDNAVLLSTGLTELQGALDVEAGEQRSLADEQDFQTALVGLHADRLGLFYINTQSIVEYLRSSQRDLGLPFNWSAYIEQVPGVIVAQLSAEADHLLLEAHSLPRRGGSLPSSAPSRSTDLAALFPAGTLAYAEVRDVGAGIKEAFRQLKEFSDELGEDLPLPADLEQLLGTRPEDYLDFVGDTAVGLSFSGGQLGGGLVSQLTDESAARQRIERLVASLRAMVAFGGSDVPLTISDEFHGDVSVTVFRLREIPGMEVPFSSFSYAIADGRLLIGFDDFVIDALDGGPAASLAQAAGYSRALRAAGGAQNSGHLFLDIGGLRSLAEEALPPGGSREYDEVKPYLEPIGELMLTYSSAGDTQIQRTVLFIDRP